MKHGKRVYLFGLFGTLLQEVFGQWAWWVLWLGLVGVCVSSCVFLLSVSCVFGNDVSDCPRYFGKNHACSFVFLAPFAVYARSSNKKFKHSQLTGKVYNGRDVLLKRTQHMPCKFKRLVCKSSLPVRKVKANPHFTALSALLPAGPKRRGMEP